MIEYDHVTEQMFFIYEENLVSSKDAANNCVVGHESLSMEELDFFIEGSSIYDYVLSG
jgi:hypothetical protein